MSDDAGSDPIDGPDGQAERSKEAARHVRRLEDDLAVGRPIRHASLPMPRHLIGSTSPWDGPLDGRPCPVCTGMMLDASTLCLYCGRWGLDQLVPKVAPEARRVIAMAEKGGPGLAGGKGSARPGKVKAAPKKRGPKPLGSRLKRGLGTLTVA